MKRTAPFAFFAIILLLCAASGQLLGADQDAEEASWPQFRGPNANGLAALANPPVNIGPTENVRWQVDVPWSPSSPVVWGDRIFLTAADRGELQTRCYDRGDGRLLWAKGVQPKQLETFHQTDGSPAASTPATDGRHVVSYFGSFGLVCYDLNGTELWQRPMPVARSGGSFGTGTSPILTGSTVVLLRDESSQSKLVALDADTGDLLWESPRPEATGSFGTPIVWNNQGVEEIVTPGSVQLKGYSLKSGQERWTVNGLTTFACTTPVLGNDQLYFGAWCPGGADNPWPAWTEFCTEHDRNKDGEIALEEFTDQARDFYRALDLNEDGRITETDWSQLREMSSRGVNQLVAVRPGGQGDITKTHVVWSFEKGLPYVPSPLFYQDRIYMIRDGGMLSSINAVTGRPFYAQKRIGAEGSYYASPVAADGRLYLVSLRGKLSVVQAGGDKPKILHQVDFGERVFATPALVNDNLYLRTEAKLYAFGAVQSAR